jgi:hypothetical protein
MYETLLLWLFQWLPHQEIWTLIDSSDGRDRPRQLSLGRRLRPFLIRSLRPGGSHPLATWPVENALSPLEPFTLVRRSDPPRWQRLGRQRTVKPGDGFETYRAFVTWWLRPRFRDVRAAQLVLVVGLPPFLCLVICGRLSSLIPLLWSYFYLCCL